MKQLSLEELIKQLSENAALLKDENENQATQLGRIRAFLKLNFCIFPFQIHTPRIVIWETPEEMEGKSTNQLVVDACIYLYEKITKS